MLKQIISFGFRNGTPTDGVVIDLRRTFRNPYHDRSLRELRGTDFLVQEEIKKTANFAVLYEHLKAQATVPGIEVLYLGCSGGHHRSVFLAERLGKELGVPVHHRDIST